MMTGPVVGMFGVGPVKLPVVWLTPMLPILVVCAGAQGQEGFQVTVTVTQVGGHVFGKQTCPVMQTVPHGVRGTLQPHFGLHDLVPNGRHLFGGQAGVAMAGEADLVGMVTPSSSSRASSIAGPAANAEGCGGRFTSRILVTRQGDCAMMGNLGR